MMLLLAGTDVRANNEDEIARCARIFSTDYRILCLEEALRQSAQLDNRAILVPLGEPTDPPVAAVVAPSTKNAPEKIQEFGLSETQRNPDALASVSVVIVSVDKNAYGKLTFRTEKGQVWRQTDKGKPRYRRIPFEAEIRKGAAGSFLIKPLAGGIAVRVKRNK